MSIRWDYLHDGNDLLRRLVRNIDLIIPIICHLSTKRIGEKK